MTPAIFFSFCDKVMITKTFLNQICRNKQSNEMFGFEMAKCVLIHKIEREAIGNAMCRARAIYSWPLRKGQEMTRQEICVPFSGR